MSAYYSHVITATVGTPLVLSLVSVMTVMRMMLVDCVWTKTSVISTLVEKAPVSTTKALLAVTVMLALPKTLLVYV